MSHALATPLAIPTPKPRGTHRSPLGRLGPSPRPSVRLAAVSTAAAPPVALSLRAPLSSPIEREAADSCSTIFFSGRGVGEEEARPPSSRPGNTARPSCHRRPALRCRGGPREPSSSSRLPPFSIPSCNIYTSALVSQVCVEEYDAGSPVNLSELDGTWRLNYTSASDVLVLFEAAARLPFLQVLLTLLSHSFAPVLILSP